MLKGKDILKEEQYIDVLIALAFIGEAQKRLAAVHLSLDDEEFDGIQEIIKVKGVSETQAYEELGNLLNSTENACTSYCKRLRNVLEKEYDG